MYLKGELHVDKSSWGFIDILGRKCDDCGIKKWFAWKIPFWFSALNRYQIVPYIMCKECMDKEKSIRMN